MKYFAKFYYIQNEKMISHIGSDCYANLDGRLSIPNMIKQAQKYAYNSRNIQKIDEIRIFKAIDFRQFINDNGDFLGKIGNN